MQNVLNQFRIDIVDFRQSNVFRNFSIKFEIVTNSFVNNSSSFLIFRVQFSSKQFLVFKFDISIRFEIFTIIQFEISINSKFRRNNNSEIRDFIFSSLIFNYSSIINFDFDLNISRQFIVESNITNNERRSINIQIDNNQIFFFIQIEKIRRIMFSIISSSIEINSILWNDIMIVIIVFVSMSRFVAKIFFFCQQYFTINFQICRKCEIF